MLFLTDEVMVLAMEFDYAATDNVRGASSGLAARGLNSYPLSSLWAVLSNSLSVPQFNTQAGGGAGGLGGPSLGPGGLGTGSGYVLPGPQGLRIIPVLSISERYDNNVFLVPNTSSLKREDWVTSAIPQLYVQDTGRLVTTTLRLGAIGEYYARNTALGYIGYNASGSLNLTGLVQQLLPQTSLFVAGGLSYNPTPPGFLAGADPLNPIIGQEITSQLPLERLYIAGLQSTRVNTFGYTSSVTGYHRYSANLTLQASYYYANTSFGTPAAGGTAGLFVPAASRTVSHGVTLAPSYRVTEQDSMVLRYSYTRSSFSGNLGVFNMHEGTIGWSHRFSPSLDARIFGGASAFTQEFVQVSVSNPAGNVQSSGQVLYSGGVLVNWTLQNTVAGFQYSAGISPSYLGATGLLMSNAVGAYVSQRLLDNLIASLNLNYAHNSAIGGTADSASLRFESYAASAGLNYRLASSSFALLRYEYGLYKGAISSFLGSTQSGSADIERQAVIVSLIQYF